MADWTEERFIEAEEACRAAGLSAEEVAGVQAWLMGALLTHFDPEQSGGNYPTPLSPERWREYLRRAIAAR